MTGSVKGPLNTLSAIYWVALGIKGISLLRCTWSDKLNTWHRLASRPTMVSIEPGWSDWYNTTVIWKSVKSSETVLIVPRRSQRLNVTQSVASITARRQDQLPEGDSLVYSSGLHMRNIKVFYFVPNTSTLHLTIFQEMIINLLSHLDSTEYIQKSNVTILSSNVNTKHPNYILCNY